MKRNRIWLTSRRGRVWFGADGRTPAAASWVCDDIFGVLPDGFENVDLIVPGLRDNAPLIVRLLSAMPDSCRLYACSPRTAAKLPRDTPPAAVLSRFIASAGSMIPKDLDASEMLGAASAGGARLVTKNDFQSYFLFYWHSRYGSSVAQAEAHKGFPSSSGRSKAQDDATALKLLRSHPAYRWLNYLGSMPEQDLLNVLGFIAEPRWFRRPDRPDKSRLDSALRVVPFSCALYFENKRQQLHPETVSLFNLVCAVYALDDEAQRRWLWQEFSRYPTFNEGLLHATRAFLRYLDATWVASTSHTRQPHELFVPRYFFADRDVAAAYDREFARLVG